MPSGNDRRARILLLDSDADRAAELSCRLDFLDYQPVIFETGGNGAEIDSVAVVFGATGKADSVHTTANCLRESHPSLPFLCLTDTAGLGSGPNWSLEAPLRRSQFERLLKRAERYHGAERRHRITGTSHPIRRVRRLMEQVADFDTTVLVTGESGTGKELVARTIHDLSERADRPFVPVNCGAIPAELLESELFGHEKGSFTGAISSRRGRFELAEGGTLFLDEIGEMSLDMQVKLLRVLQERSFERIGSNRLKACDVRIIAATHVDIPRAVSKGEFREDLYYRLNVFPIEMPPLYKRVTDLPQLFEELLITRAGAEKGRLRLDPEALAALASYRWPGNIRELSNLVERIAIMKPAGMITLDDLPQRYRCNAQPANSRVSRLSDDGQPVKLNLKEHLRALEAGLIGEAMARSDGVVAQAARLLSMRRTTLVEKVARYRID